MKHLVPAAILALALFCFGCAKPAALRPGGPTPAAAMPDSANPNAAELAAFAASYPRGSEEARAAAFLLDNLPLADRLSMTADELRENLDYAFLARRSMPWGAGLPWDIFLHFVLPHRTSQEPFQAHRAMLFRELAPLCATAADMEEALSRVGAWCAARAQYRPTSRRDLGVVSVLEAGWGRCEETNILFMAAARAVGLPVRQAMVPWWQHADGNHAWVEAWTGDGWKFLESGTEFTELNRTWFAAQAPRMAKVAAHVFGPWTDASVYRTGPGFSLADSTAAYVRPVSVRVRVTVAHDQPVPGHDVYFSVYSLGAVRPVTKAATDGRGVVQTVLGPGVFLVSCSAGEGLAWTMLDTRDMEDMDIRLQADSPAPLPDTLEFACPEAAADSFDATPSPELRRLREERAERWTPLLRDLPAPLPERLALAGDRTPGWLRLLQGGAGSPWTGPLLETLDDKDLLQADPETLAREADLALRARQAAEAAGLRVDDGVFRDYVLSPRIHLEPWSPWRAELLTWLGPYLGLSLPAKIDAVRTRIEKLKTQEPALMGPPLTPAQCHGAGYCATAWDKGVLAAAALRTLGVPARFQPDFGRVEYFDGTKWHFWELEPGSPAEGVLRLTGSGELRPFLDFGLTRVEKGHLRPLDDLPWEGDEGSLRCALQPGPYLLVLPRREGTRTTVRLEAVSIEAGAATDRRVGGEAELQP
jgi:hypothetical protein